MTKIFDDFKHFFESSCLPSCQTGEFLPIPKNVFDIEEQKHGFVFPQDFKDLYSVSNGIDFKNASAFRDVNDEFDVLGVGFYINPFDNNPEFQTGIFPVFLYYLPINNTLEKKHPHVVEYHYPGSPDSQYMGGAWDGNLEYGKEAALLPYKDWPDHCKILWREEDSWYPEKKFEYINIGETITSKYILLGVKENTYGKVYYWNYPEKERDAPTLVADSLYEFLARLQVVYDD